MDSEQQAEKARWRQYGPELRLLLWALWDPIPAGVPLDEYDSYAPRVWKLLHDGANAVVIARDLTRWRTDNIGAAPNDDRDLSTTHRLMDWWYWRFEFPQQSGMSSSI